MEKLRVILGPEATPRSPAFTHRSPEYAQTQQHAPIVESVGPVTLSTGERLEARIKYYWFGVDIELATPRNSNAISIPSASKPIGG